jgi:ATP-dependent DNA helicase RecG
LGETDKVIETIYLSYFKGIISYNGIQRIETYPVPHAAFREAITNAIVHRDYSTGIPIQIKVLPNKVIIYNDGRLPQNWTVEDLMKTHRSQPYNPLIASTFFRSGQIESWGRGIEKITEVCKTWGKPAPTIELKYNSEFAITFDCATNNAVNVMTDETSKDTVNAVKDTTNTLKDTVNTAKDTVKDTVTDTQNQILKLLAENSRMTIKTMSAKLGINERNVKKNIKTLKNTGIIERIGSDKSGHWAVKRLV